MTTPKQPCLSRRSLLQTTLGASASLAVAVASPAVLRGVAQAPSAAAPLRIVRQPDLLRMESGTATGAIRAERNGSSWSVAGAKVVCTESGDGLALTLEAKAVPVRRIHLRWRLRIDPASLVLGDAWERSYGDLAWLPLRAERVLPWYFLVSGAGTVRAAGVRTGPGALAFWQVDEEGVSLWLDVRNGGEGVLLGDRVLALATVVESGPQPSGNAWQAAVAFCRAMASKETVPRRRGSYRLDAIYGSNDWYYAYGKNTAKGILRDADLIRELAPSGPVKPFCIVDDGYQDPARFPDMGRLAETIRGKDVVPGLWIRPLRAPDSDAENLMLPRSHWVHADTERVYDPTIPEANERVLQVVKQACGWGYDFIKHDFTTFELLGQWGFSMGASPTKPGWSFHDRTRTNAEIIRSLYKDIRTAAGEDRIVLGCNTIGHLSVGIFDASRTGDDVSGRDWERTRRIGVNTLAFRLPQNGTFFATDADCVPITPEIDPEHTEQWLQALAASGSVLLVSPDPKAIGKRQKESIRRAFAMAAKAPTAEPLDWMESPAPSRWKLAGAEHRFAWVGPEGASPFALF